MDKTELELAKESVITLKEMMIEFGKAFMIAFRKIEKDLEPYSKLMREIINARCKKENEVKPAFTMTKVQMNVPYIKPINIQQTPIDQRTQISRFYVFKH